MTTTKVNLNYLHGSQNYLSLICLRRLFPKNLVQVEFMTYEVETRNNKECVNIIDHKHTQLIRNDQTIILRAMNINLVFNLIIYINQ